MKQGSQSGKTRQVDMSDQLAGVLTEHRKAIAAAALKVGKPLPELVFPSTTWTPMDASHIRRDLNAVLKKAQMHRIRFHDTRHTFASLLLHLIPGENRQAVNRLDDPDWSTAKAVGASTGNRMATDEEKGVRLVSLTP